MKKTLVTGGAGFIGSHLCKKLLNLGKKVLCLDNMFTGTYDNISELYSNLNFEYHHYKCIHPLQLDVDEIYNLACPASPLQYQYDPIMTTKTSFLGALNVLDLAKRNGAKVLQASTSEIYGILWCILRLRIIEGMLTQLAQEHVTMREKELQRHFFRIIDVFTA